MTHRGVGHRQLQQFRITKLKLSALFEFFQSSKLGISYRLGSGVSRAAIANGNQLRGLFLISLTSNKHNELCICNSDETINQTFLWIYQDQNQDRGGRFLQFGQ